MSLAASRAQCADLKSRFFEGLTPDDVSSILAAATLQRFPANAVVFSQGYPADGLYLLVEGRARHFYNTPEGQKILLPWIQPGDPFGFATLLPGSTSYLISAETVTDSTAFHWNKASIQGLARRHPKLKENAYSMAAELMSGGVNAHIGLIYHNARERLAQILVNLARDIGSRRKGGIELVLTNEDLADAASITRFTASRLMSEWGRRGVLKKSRGKVLLRSTEKLFTP